jgi:hypothetical protein
LTRAEASRRLRLTIESSNCWMSAMLFLQLELNLVWLLIASPKPDCASAA